MEKQNKSRIDHIIKDNVKLMKQLMGELSQIELEKQLALVKARK